MVPGFSFDSGSSLILQKKREKRGGFNGCVCVRVKNDEISHTGVWYGDKGGGAGGERTDTTTRTAPPWLLMIEIVPENVLEANICVCDVTDAS